MRGLIASALVFASVYALFPIMAGASLWQPAMPGVPPGGFATITVEGVRHGDRSVPSDVQLRVTSDKEGAATLVKPDGRYVTQLGRPFKSMTENPVDLPQWDFVQTQVLEVPITGLAHGVHHIEIRECMIGSSIPIINAHDIWFSVGD